MRVWAVDKSCKALRDRAIGYTIWRTDGLLALATGRFLQSWKVYSLQPLKGDQSWQVARCLMKNPSTFRAEST
jgi:hypothetical protein